jgi:hypothetical protein
MKHILSKTISLIIIVTLVVIGIFYSRLPTLLSDKISQALQVFVSVKDVSLRPSTIAISDLTIGNVSPGILPKAFSAKTIDFSAPLTNYINNPINIDTITIDDIYLGLEFDSPTSTTGNWATLFQPLTSKKNSSPNAKTSVFIKTLVLTNIQVELVYRNNPGNIKKLPPIDKIILTDINTEEGMPMEQIMHSVLGQMLKSVFIKENIKNTLDDLLSPQSEVNKLLSPLKGLFGG